MSEQHVGVLIIGGGSGLTATYYAEAAGKEVALIEPGPLGGTCVNRGCIPTKTLIEAAEVLRSLQGAEELGIHVEQKAINVDVPAIFGRMREMREANVGYTDEWIEGSQAITLHRERATFVDERTVELSESGTRISADTVFICTGAHPFVPPIDGIDEVDHHTSRTVLNEMEDAPERLVILGGGYIGMEFANFFSAVGTEVTIVEALDKILAPEDHDVSQAVLEAAQGYATVHTGAMASSVAQDGEEIVVTCDRDDESFEVRGDALLVATGRAPNTRELGLEAAGIETSDRGWIEVDEQLATTAEGVYAYGDVIGQGMFKHTSSFEGQVAWENSQGGDRVMDYRTNPHAVFSHPQVGGVGLTEEEAEEQGLSFRTHTLGYDATAKGEIVRAPEGTFAKAVVEEGSERILGVHLVGPQAADLIHEVVVAMNCGDGAVSNITEAIHVHPTLSELVHTLFSQA